MRLEPPRGTHDITPAEQPLWQRVTGEMERLCALYGYRPIQTPGFEDTDLFQRTSGEGSDVVQKEMYTFTDRSDRSLTLRPEGTAPICRAYLSHGLQQEPQPQKLYTIAPMYRYGRPGPRALSRALAALGGGDRLRRPRARRRGAASLRHAAPESRHHPVPPRAELDRRPRVPPRLCRAALRAGSASASRSSMGRRARSSARVPCGRSTTLPPSRRTCRSSSATRPRSATPSVTTASGTSPRCARSSTSSASRTRSCRRSSAGSTTTRAPPGSSSARSTAPTRRSPAVAATTG